MPNPSAPLPLTARQPIRQLLPDTLPSDPLAGLTAGEALERLKDYPHPDRDDGHLLAAIVERYRQPSLLARLWTRLRQAWCNHAAATAHRVPGFGPGPVFERCCGRCGARWSEYG